MNYCPMCATELTTIEIEHRNRQSCPSEACNFTDWNNPTPVVAAIIEWNNKVLLVHNTEWPDKVFGLVTGFLEEKEAPEQAIAREIKEELNLRAETVSLVGAYAFEHMNQVIIAYHAECSGEITLNEELDDYKLLDRSKLKPWGFGTGLAVKDWLASL